MTSNKDAQRIIRTISTVFRRSTRSTTQSPSRSFTSSWVSLRGRDIVARYHPTRRAPTIHPSRYKAIHPRISPSDEFATSSTQPVGTSFQTVPSPSSPESTDGVQIRQPVPAMLATSLSIDSSNATTGSSDSSSSSAAATKLEPAQTRGFMVVQGVRIPPKPRPPGEEECCMSGCVHCVYTIYADELEEYNEALGAAKDALVKAGIPTSQWPDEVRAKDGSTSDQVEKQVEKVMESVDPSMAAFLALEGKLKKKTS
ncbi:oxidoreductase-like protein [Papiliotrema laurentii]|uniref:Oxidoreductase-like protein n=1 Tax=Papiliotrema laurentii TaxID=5418 RepID=A0AAD9FMA3_PAPLA|nr:oxidoreductase-like protein [Papiliotrema laurentii]